MTEAAKEALISIAAVLGQKFEPFGETFITTTKSKEPELAYPLLVQEMHGAVSQVYVMRNEQRALAIAEALNVFPQLVVRVIELEEGLKGEKDDKANEGC